MNTLFCPKRGREFSVHDGANRARFYETELVRFLHFERGYPLEWIHIGGRFPVGSGNRTVETDVLVTDVESGKNVLVCEVKCEQSPAAQEKTINRQLFANALLAQCAGAVYWSATNKWFFRGLVRKNHVCDSERFSYEYVPYCRLRTEGRPAGARIVRRELQPLQEQYDTWGHVERVVRQWQGSVTGEKVAAQIFKVILAKYYDEIVNCRADDVMRFQVEEGGGAATAAAVQALFGEAGAYFKGKCAAMAFDGGIELSERCLLEVVRGLQGFSLQESPRWVIQDVYTKFAPRQLRAELNQYYTPSSPVRFVAAALEVGRGDRFVDPACGTGDFVAGIIKHHAETRGDSVAYVKENAYAWDMDAGACRLAGLNLILNGDGLSRVENVDSLARWDKMNGEFRFVVTNPPFGKNDKVREAALLARYALWREYHPKADGIEVGALFVERCMNLLQEGGICGIVLPDSYLTLQSYNFLRRWLMERHRLLAVIKLPDITFELTSVKPKTSLVFLQKGGGDANEDYEIFLFWARRLGFKINKKRAENLYWYDEAGRHVMGEDGRPMLIDDLAVCRRQLAGFARANNVAGLVRAAAPVPYEFMKKSEVLAAAGKAECAVFMKRRTPEMVAALQCAHPRAYALGACCEVDRGRAPEAVESGRRYRYVDTGGALYGSCVVTRLSGRYLPGRARVFEVARGDVLVATQNGHRNFVVARGEEDGVFFSSGFFRVRIAEARRRVDFLAFLLSERWGCLAQGLAVGATQEDVQVEDFLRIRICPASEEARAAVAVAVAAMTRREEVGEWDRVNEEFGAVAGGDLRF